MRLWTLIAAMTLMLSVLPQVASAQAGCQRGSNTGRNARTTAGAPAPSDDANRSSQKSNDYIQMRGMKRD